MRLRTRLAVISLAVTLPTIAGLYLLDAHTRHRAAERLLASAVSMQMSGERERCEADPRGWGGEPIDHRPPPRRFGPPPDGGPPDGGPPDGPPPNDGGPHGAAPVLFAYADDLESQNPDAPPVDPALRAAIDERGWASPRALWPSDDVYVLVRMPWSEGPCALVLAHGTTTAGWLGSILPVQPIWLVPAFAMLVGLWLAAGPMVRRIGQLADAVQRAPTEDFESTELDGRDEIAELSRAYARAAATVRAQLEEISRREQSLREFVANTTHDVMTPLTVLADYLTSLEQDAREQQRPELKTVIAAMDEVQYLASIIDNLALVAKLDSAEPIVVREPVELDAVVERVVARHRPIASKLGVELDYGLADPLVVVIGDLTMLEQALGNLVHNAIRYNDPGGHVAVVVERPSPERFVVRVLDDGPGIPEADLRRLVERGARGDAARTREPRGQGLGLSIVFRVAELHGFSLELGRSEPGGLEVDLAGPVASAGVEWPRPRRSIIPAQS